METQLNLLLGWQGYDKSVVWYDLERWSFDPRSELLFNTWKYLSRSLFYFGETRNENHFRSLAEIKLIIPSSRSLNQRYLSQLSICIFSPPSFMCHADKKLGDTLFWKPFLSPNVYKWFFDIKVVESRHICIMQVNTTSLRIVLFSKGAPSLPKIFHLGDHWTRTYEKRLCRDRLNMIWSNEGPVDHKKGDPTWCSIAMDFSRTASLQFARSIRKQVFFVSLV